MKNSKWGHTGGARRWQALAGYVLAVLATAILGSVVQTQFNMAAIASLGPEIPWGLRAQVTGRDLLGFAPTLALLVGAAFAVGLPLAALLARTLGPRGRIAVFAVAGGLALFAAIAAMNALLPVTPIAATRELVGMVSVALSGGVGGWLYAVATR